MHAPGLFERVRGEFNEMPGLQLTVSQAARLWGLDPAACQRIIEALVEASFLRWTPAGTIVRAQH
jgi:DNA-binding IclR family transcriptional regulator